MRSLVRAEGMVRDQAEGKRSVLKIRVRSKGSEKIRVRGWK